MSSALCLLFTANAFAEDSSPLSSLKTTEFGLIPPSHKVSQKQALPSCEEFGTGEEAEWDLQAHKGLCLGKITDDPSAQETMSAKPEFWLESEIQYQDSVVRFLKRNPELMPLTRFLSVCSPLGGYISSDGLSCGYVILF